MPCQIKPDLQYGSSQMDGSNALFHNIANKGTSLSAPPLVVDCDGTLVFTDTLHEAALRVLRDKPLAVFSIPFWLMKGKAYLKQKLATCSEFDASSLPYNQALIAWLKEQQAAGRSLVLCTAADQVIAQAVAKHLGLFNQVIASDGEQNVAGRHKAAILVQQFGEKGFDYVGNAQPDLQVWQHARRAIVVNASESLERAAAACCEVEKIFSKPEIGLSVWRRALRLHQWMKNCLLFVPILAAHQIPDVMRSSDLLMAFLSFSLCASAVYLANDLLDLDSDRQHPRKKFRPFASGQLSVVTGVLLAPLLLIAAMWLGLQIPGQFLGWLIFYFILTCAYSLLLKRVVLIDCLTLAVLYTVRLIAGASAASMSLSFWLLAFAVFLFLSLAFVKRYAELEIQLLSGKEKAHGRGYLTSDASLVQTLGVTAGFSAVLVLALYLNSDAVVKLYKAPEIIWGAVPVMLFWISWMWMQAHRGKMHDDPLVFALKDKASLSAGIVFALVLLAGAGGWPW